MNVSTTSRPQRGWPRYIPHVVFALILIGLLLIGVVAWIGSERALNPDLQESQFTLVNYPEFQPELITFESTTDIMLQGRFFPGENGATVVLSHGFSEQQDQLLPYVKLLQDSGYSVFTFNGRNRSDDGNVFATLGVLEQHDLRSAIDYLVTREDVDPDRIGAHGISLGGATSILAAGNDDRIQAVIAEASFSDPESVISTSFERFIGLPSFPFAPVTVWVAEWRAGESLADAQPIEVVDEISPRPILLIHGTGDEAVPPDHSQRLYDAADQPKELWLVEDAGHTDSYATAEEDYADRYISFFDEHLAAD